MTKRAVWKYTIEDVKKICSEHGYTILDEHYKDLKTPLKCICPCGKEDYKCVDAIRNGQKCRDCGYKNRRDDKKFTYDFVKQSFIEAGCVLHDTEYRDARTYLEFTCSCGRRGKVQFYFFRKGRRCKECALDKQRGPNNHNYNPNLTDEERFQNRDYSEYTHWSFEVKKRDRFTCQLCGDDRGGNLVSHHLDSYKDFPELRTELDNGITLCTPCHKWFHFNYGYGNNRKEQFFEILDFIEGLAQ